MFEASANQWSGVSISSFGNAIAVGNPGNIFTYLERAFPTSAPSVSSEPTYYFQRINSPTTEPTEDETLPPTPAEPQNSPILDSLEPTYQPTLRVPQSTAKPFLVSTLKPTPTVVAVTFTADQVSISVLFVFIDNLFKL